MATVRIQRGDEVLDVIDNDTATSPQALARRAEIRYPGWQAIKVVLDDTVTPPGLPASNVRISVG